MGGGLAAGAGRQGESMGLLDDVLKSALGGSSSGNAGGLLEGVLDALGDERSGGLDGLARASQQQGLGDLLASWIGTGPNRPISSGELTDLLGRERIDAIAQRGGLASALAPGILASVLPALIDRLTPDGSVPQRAVLAERGRDIMAGIHFAQPQPQVAEAATPASSPSAPRTVAEAAPVGVETYVVVAGDSLSKIALRLLGNAGEWQRIYEANRAVIGANPDLIRPGQKLAIPR